MAERKVSLGEARTILAQAATGSSAPTSDEFKAACGLALQLMPLGPEVRTPATIMVCSDCGAEIARLEPLPAGGQFDIYDCSWPCPGCGRLWLSSHGWQEVGNLLIPYGDA